MKVIAVIGCGRIANAAHLPALSKLDNVRIKYACDLIEEKALEAQKNFQKLKMSLLIIISHLMTKKLKPYGY